MGSKNYSLERTDCPQCGGSGEVMEVVDGHSGYVPCPDCDNVPRFAVPNEIPDDPEARLDEIEEQIEELDKVKDAWQEYSGKIRNGRDALQRVASDDRFPNPEQDRFEALAKNITDLLQDADIGAIIIARRSELTAKYRELETFLEHADSDSTDE